MVGHLQPIHNISHNLFPNKLEWKILLPLKGQTDEKLNFDG